MINPDPMAMNIDGTILGRERNAELIFTNGIVVWDVICDDAKDSGTWVLKDCQFGPLLSLCRIERQINDEAREYGVLDEKKWISSFKQIFLRINEKIEVLSNGNYGAWALAL